MTVRSFAVEVPAHTPIGVKDIILFRGADKQDRPAIVTKVVGATVNAVVFGTDHGDCEAGLKCGLVQKVDHWVAHV